MAINKYAFKDCEQLQSIAVPYGITAISSNAFNNCQALIDINLPETLKTIATDAFAGCSSLKSISLPASMKSIDGSAFPNLASVENVNSFGPVPPSVDADAFKGSFPQYMTLHVPKGRKDIYAATNWSMFVNILEDLELPDYLKYPASMATGTLPIIYINTENEQLIVDKVTPIPAGLYMTVPDGSEYATVGSEVKPVALTIRGRGNSSWTLPQKPYKLKFDKKTSLLNLPKSKHYALLHMNQGFVDYHASMSAMEMMRRLTGRWAPHILPVELVLNGRYDGLYFLAETIKIDPNRVNIFEQEDGETDPEIIPYGWLVEIDNYDDEYQISIPETEIMNLRVTYKSPEKLSSKQLEWLTDEFKRIVASVYGREGVDEKWTDIIDVRSVAEYFIIRELYHDYEAYSGSFYMHKDKGENAKWKFGPLWDVNLSEWNKPDWVLNCHPEYAAAHLIAPIIDTPEFKTLVNEIWEENFPRLIDDIKIFIDEATELIDAADLANYDRWPEISEEFGAYSRGGHLKEGLENNYTWISDHIKNLSKVDDITIGEYDSTDVPEEYYNLQGIAVKNLTNGVFIRKKGSTVEKVFVK